MPSRIERLLDALHQRDRLRPTAPAAMNGALAKPMPCSPLIEPSSATTPCEQRALGLVRPRDLLRVVRVHHDVDVDVAVAGVAEARDPQAEVLADPPTSAKSSGMRPFGTTTSWLYLSGVIILSDRDSSRRTRHSSWRSASSRARRTSVAPGVAARGLDSRRLVRDRRRRRRRPRAAASRPCLRAPAIAPGGTARPLRANRRRSARPPPGRRARG